WKLASYNRATCPEHETHRVINSGVGLDCEIACLGLILKNRCIGPGAQASPPGGQLTTTMNFVKNVVTGDVSDLKMSGLFFAIGHELATKFLDSQLELDEDGYVVTKPGTTKTSVVGVFSAGDVQDKSYRQALPAAGTASRP
ncbi:hypothetical protein HID58_039645, partial [Brassica napus]